MTDDMRIDWMEDECLRVEFEEDWVVVTDVWGNTYKALTLREALDKALDESEDL